MDRNKLPYVTDKRIQLEDYGDQAVDTRERTRGVAVVLPTLNAGTHARGIVESLQSQSLKPDDVIILDSASTDGSDAVFRAAGFNVHPIDRRDFDHGGTRNVGLRLAGGADVVVFLTQDAIPVDETLLANLVAPFDNPAVGLVFARQLPRLEAGAIESHARFFNYPDRRAVRAMPEAATLGVKAVFNSNACSAYRTVALNTVHGFPTRTICGEDQIAAGRILIAGWQVVYEPKARVRHSHDYTVVQEFKRYFDIGVFHRDYGDFFAPFGPAESEGRRFVLSELGYLLRRRPHLIPEALLRTATKYAGYKLGQRHASLPAGMRSGLAMNPGFFRSKHNWREDSVSETLRG